MRISEVIEVLEEYKKEAGDVTVYMSKDEEGNGYNDVYGHYLTRWADGGEYDIGNPLHPEDLAEAIEWGEDVTEEDFPLVVVLW